MNNFSRRDFLNMAISLSLAFPLYGYAMNGDNDDHHLDYPITTLALKKAFTSEMTAYKHYLKYVEKALDEKYPNIAYLFQAFSLSEKIHAQNYQRIINELGSEVIDIVAAIKVGNTKANLRHAAKKELEKIVEFYPQLLEIIEPESCEQAIMNCMYAWKSHRQHEEKVTEIQKYSGFFFGSMASHIEEKDLDFYVCNICGSTIDKTPKFPCEICNKSMTHYKKVNRPT